MEIKEMTVDQIESRKAEIIDEIEKPEADLNALEEEARALNAELESRKAAEAQKAEIRSAVTSGKGEVIETFKKEEKTMETRKAEMIDALAEYIKGTATPEQRAMLLTTNATGGTVKVSDIVDDYVWTDWAKSPILSRIRKKDVQGKEAIVYHEACKLACAEDFESALQAFLNLYVEAPEWNDGAAKKAMLTLFGVLGPKHELTWKYRAKLNTMMFI